MRETHQHRDPSNVDSDGAFHAPYNSPGPFSILGPQGTINDPTPEITWEASAGASYYQVVVSSQPDLSQPVWEHLAFVNSDTLAVLLDEGTYYVGVTASSGEGSIEATNSGVSFVLDDPIPQFHTIFATSFATDVSTDPSIPPYFPSFGSMEAADWIVTFAAFNAGHFPGWNGLEIVYQSVLSIDGTDVRDRIAIGGAVYNTGGELIATDQADLWDGSIQNPVGFDEYGNAVVGNADAWTGSLSDGTWSASSCGNWDNPSDSEIGSFGISLDVDASWLFSSHQICNRTSRLYGISPPLDSLPMPAGPLADADGPYSIVLGNPLTLDGSGSLDPNGDPLSYTWDLNDDGTFGDAVGSTTTRPR